MVRWTNFLDVDIGVRTCSSSSRLANLGRDLIDLEGDPLGSAGAEAMATILQAAAARGEVRLDRIAPRVASLPTDLARHELLFRRTAVPDDVLTEIVDDVFLPLVQGVSRST